MCFVLNHLKKFSIVVWYSDQYVIISRFFLYFKSANIFSKEKNQWHLQLIFDLEKNPNSFFLRSVDSLWFRKEAELVSWQSLHSLFIFFISVQGLNGLCHTPHIFGRGQRLRGGKGWYLIGELRNHHQIRTVFF